MTARRAARVLAGIALTDLTFRTSQVALPLVVLTGTGSAAATGLVGGAAGVPVLLSPWWTRRLRQRIRSGRAIAACYAGEAVSLAVVAAAATLGLLHPWVLGLAGLLLGCFEALDGPGRDALVADLGDGLGPDRALRLLTLRDLFRRLGMVVGPGLGGLLVTAGLAVPLLWVEVGSVLVSAALTVGVPAASGPPSYDDHAPGIWRVARVRPDVLAGWVVRGTGCGLWFGFTLGLGLLGVEQGRGGTLLAAGMTAFGVGSLLATVGVVGLLQRLPALPAIAAAWAVTGGCWLAMGLTRSVIGVAVAAFVSGLAVPLGNAGVTAQITRGSTGAERRTLLAGQSLVVNAASATGLLAGGPVLALVGPAATLVAAGSVTALVAAGVLLARGQAYRRATPAARAPYPPPNRQACTSSGNSWWRPARSSQPSASGETSW